jgi:protein required for attachment to host cells
MHLDLPGLSFPGENQMTTTWALVADRNHASIFKTKGRMKGLELVEQFTHTAGHIEEDSASHAPEPPQKHTATDADALQFAHELAVKLRLAHSQHRFDHLVLAAEPKFLGMLRKVIDSVTARSIVGEVQKHLGGRGDGDLARQIYPAIPL